MAFTGFGRADQPGPYHFFLCQGHDHGFRLTGNIRGAFARDFLLTIYFCHGLYLEMDWN